MEPLVDYYCVLVSQLNVELLFSKAAEEIGRISNSSEQKEKVLSNYLVKKIEEMGLDDNSTFKDLLIKIKIGEKAVSEIKRIKIYIKNNQEYYT